MGKTQVKLVARIRAPIEVVFAKLIDHEGMASWPGLSKVELVKEGQPRNGVGAVRVISARGLSLHEKIVHYQAPHRYDYTIIKGLPVDHLGSVRLTEDGDFVEVDWEVNMSSRIPFFAQYVGRLLRKGLPKALQHVKRELESS